MHRRHENSHRHASKPHDHGPLNRHPLLNSGPTDELLDNNGLLHGILSLSDSWRWSATAPHGNIKTHQRSCSDPNGVSAALVQHQQLRALVGRWEGRRLGMAHQGLGWHCCRTDCCCCRQREAVPGRCGHHFDYHGNASHYQNRYYDCCWEDGYGNW